MEGFPSAPQKNEVTKPAPEKKEGLKPLEIEYEGKKYQLEISSSDFEYPKDKQESGIIGYTRQKIEGEKIFALINTVLEEKGINLSEIGITNIEDWGRETTKKRLSGRDEYPKGLLEARKLADDICISILSNLSNGEYPMNTINHQMSAYASLQKENHRKEFIEDKFFLQKVYDLDLLENTEGSFFNSHHSNVDLNVFDKKTNQPVQYGEGVSFSSVAKRFGKQLENDEVFLTTGDKGLNFAGGSFFGHATDSVSFGFSDTEPLFDEYLTKAIEIDSREFKNQYGREVFYGDSVKELVKAKILGQDFLKKFISSKSFLESSSSHPYEDTEEYKLLVGNIKNSLNELGTKFNLDIDSLYNKEMRNSHSPTLEDYLTDKLCYFLDISASKNYSSASDGTLHVTLPIFMNHDEIPQLQWGHAKYAHFINEKGFNFMQFKHAGHLPSKSSIKEISPDPQSSN